MSIERITQTAELTPATPDEGTKKKRRKSSTSSCKAPKPKRPKRPKTAYHFFYDKRRSELVAESKAKGEPVENNPMSARIGEEWKEVSDKSEYEAMAEAAKADYEKAVEAYEASGQSMADCLPKKPLSAYMLFFQAKHAEAPESLVTEFAKETGKEWKALSDEEKQPFLDAAKRQREAYAMQTQLLSRSKSDLVGAAFLDACAGDRNATVASYNHDTETYTVAYGDKEDDANKATLPISLAELRARVCGDDKAVKKSRDAKPSHKKKDKPPRTKPDKKDKGETGELEHAESRAPNNHDRQGNAAQANHASSRMKTAEKKKKKSEEHIVVLADEEMINVVRLSRRLVGGACVQNLKKMCTTVGLPVSGSKSVLGTRLEYYLRAAEFKDNPFLPSASDVQDLSIDDFNEKYENETPHSIEAIVKLLKTIHETKATSAPRIVAPSH